MKCEIEFRTVLALCMCVCVWGGWGDVGGAQDERMFAYLFILRQDPVMVLQEMVS